MAKENSARRTGDRIAIPGDYQFKAYYRGNPLQRSWHFFKIDSAVKNLHLAAGQEILDAGCGSGVLSALVARQYPDIRVNALDGNPEATAFCKQQWAGLPNLRFFNGQVDRLNSFGDAQLDGIASLEVIEHITAEQGFRMLQEFFRILKPGGTLVLTTPNRKSWWPVLEKIMDAARLAPRMHADQHERLYSGSELEQMAGLCGFAVEKKQTINALAPWLAFFSEKIARQMHAWEIRQKRIPGCLLVYTLSKPR